MTSRVAMIRGEAAAPAGGPARTVAIRADMDALPVPETTGLPFASENPGVSHACGHDGHIAMLLGAAAILMRERRRLPGSVKLIFQHAEEKAPGGAIELVRAGVTKGVSAIVGLHVMNGPVGEISVATGPAASTTSDCAWIEVTGCGAHASMPDTGSIGSEIVMALHMKRLALSEPQ